jgi:hypothetical protein
MQYYFRSSDTYSYCVPQIRGQWIALIGWIFRRSKARRSKGWAQTAQGFLPVWTRGELY